MGHEASNGADGHGVSVTFRAGVIRVAGEIDLRTAPTLANALDGVTGSLVLDLQDVGFMDASGLRVLIAQRHKRLNEGGDCIVAALSHPVRRVLEISGVAEHFELPADRSDASAAGD
jgi:anti-anti-sigma factor